MVSCWRSQIKEFLYETRPLAIALNADPLQTYSSGFLDLTSARCPTSRINHAVLLVGYGYDSSSGKVYWLIKIHGAKVEEKVDISELEEEMKLAVLIAI